MNTIQKQFVFLKGQNFFSVPLSTVVEVAENIIYDSTNTLGEAFIGLMEYKDTTLPIFDPSRLSEMHSKSNSTISTENVSMSCVIVSSLDWKFSIVLDHFYKIVPMNIAGSETMQQSSGKDSDLQESMNSSFIDSISLLDKKALYNLNVQRIVHSLQRKVGNQIVNTLQKPLTTNLEHIKEEGSIAKCLCFMIGDIQFGIPIQEVVEVVDNQLVTPLFKVSPFLRGLINVRGKIYPCVDISNYLKLPYRPLNENTKFIILRHELRELAICCDNISSMKDLANKIIQNSEGLLEKSLNQISFGIANYQNQTVLIVSSRAIINSKELSSYRKES